MTEDEARRVGNAAHRLAHLREMLSEAKTKPGNLTVGAQSNGGWGYQGGRILTLNLYGNDLEAVLALLIERDALFLASFNVKVEAPR